MTQQFPEPVQYDEAPQAELVAPPAPPINNFYAPPPKPKRKIPTVAWAAPAILVALIVGGLVGNAQGTTSAQAADAAKPVPTVTQTKTNTVNVPTTPASCTVAIGLADQTILDAGQAVGIMQDMMTAINNRDAVALAKDSSSLSLITGRLQERKTPYQTAKDSCRNGIS